MTRLGDSLGPSFKLQQWHLLLFGVAPEHHRKGYGKAIMTTVEKLVSVRFYFFYTSETELSHLRRRRMVFRLS